MAGSKLNLLVGEISCYLGLPYWSNKLKNNRIVESGPFGGKGNRQQISKCTQSLLKENGLCHQKVSKRIIYNLQKKNRLGIDCSGLAYHLLDFWSKLNLNRSVNRSIIGTQSKTGVRRVNVKSLTKKINSIKIDKIVDIKTADLIVLNKKSHVLFVIKKTKKYIYYVHSSQYTKNRGVHLGHIKIINPNKNLSFQQFSDYTNQDIPYQKLFFFDKGDGIYRLKIFSQI